MPGFGKQMGDSLLSNFTAWLNLINAKLWAWDSMLYSG